jgi:cob(I)alamin adenosyltransferase
VYYQVVESRRVDGNPRQKVLVHLGNHETVEAALREWPREIETLRRFAGRGAEDSASWNFETFRSWSRETERRAESARRRADDLESNLERLRELRRRGVV